MSFNSQRRVENAVDFSESKGSRREKILPKRSEVKYTVGCNLVYLVMQETKEMRISWRCSCLSCSWSPTASLESSSLDLLSHSFCIHQRRSGLLKIQEIQVKKLDKRVEGGRVERLHDIKKRQVLREDKEILQRRRSRYVWLHIFDLTGMKATHLKVYRHDYDNCQERSVRQTWEVKKKDINDDRQLLDFLLVFLFARDNMSLLLHFLFFSWVEMMIWADETWDVKWWRSNSLRLTKGSSTTSERKLIIVIPITGVIAFSDTDDSLLTSRKTRRQRNETKMLRSWWRSWWSQEETRGKDHSDFKKKLIK